MSVVHPPLFCNSCKPPIHHSRNGVNTYSDVSIGNKLAPDLVEIAKHVVLKNHVPNLITNFTFGRKNQCLWKRILFYPRNREIVFCKRVSRFSATIYSLRNTEPWQKYQLAFIVQGHFLPNRYNTLATNSDAMAAYFLYVPTTQGLRGVSLIRQRAPHPSSFLLSHLSKLNGFHRTSIGTYLTSYCSCEYLRTVIPTPPKARTLRIRNDHYQPAPHRSSVSSDTHPLVMLKMFNSILFN